MFINHALGIDSVDTGGIVVELIIQGIDTYLEFHIYTLTDRTPPVYVYLDRYVMDKHIAMHGSIIASTNDKAKPRFTHPLLT